MGAGQERSRAFFDQLLNRGKEESTKYLSTIPKKDKPESLEQ